MGLAKNGLAVLYTGGGAEYDGGRSELQSLIDTAKRRRRGMWYSGEVGVQTPAQYKQNLKLKPSVAY